MEGLFSPQTRFFFYKYNNDIYFSNTIQITALTEMAKIDPTMTITKCVLLLQKYNSADIFKARIPPPPFSKKNTKKQQKLPHTHKIKISC